MSWTWSCTGSGPRLTPTTSGSRPCGAWATSFVPMLEEIRQSLAVRLAATYAAVFAAGAAALFGVLYWVLAHSLEERDRAAVEQRAETYALAYEQGGAFSL